MDHFKAVSTGPITFEVPVREEEGREFVKFNCYVRTKHNEIIYFDLAKWESDPEEAIKDDGHGGLTVMIDLDKIPQE